MHPKVKEARTRFSADFLDQIATTLLAGGVVAPLAALVFRQSVPDLPADYVVAGSILCFTAAFALHVTGLAILGRLAR